MSNKTSNKLVRSSDRKVKFPAPEMAKLSDTHQLSLTLPQTSGSVDYEQ